MIEYDESSKAYSDNTAIAWLRDHAPSVDKELSDAELYAKLKPAYINYQKSNLMTIMQQTTH